MNAVESRDQRRSSGREAADLLGRGIAARLAATFPAPVRASIASTALGVGLAFSIAYFVAFSWVRPDAYSGTVVSGPVWFLPAWILLIAGAAVNRPTVRIASWSIAVVTFITVPHLLVGPYVLVPWTRWGSLYTQAGRFGLTWNSQGLRPDGGTVAVLVVLATFTLVGPLGRRTTCTALAAGSVFFATGFALAQGLGDYSDFSIWQWPEDAMLSPLPVARFAEVGLGPVALVAALAATAAVIRRRHATGAVIAALGAVTLSIGVLAAALTAQLGVGV